MHPFGYAKKDTPSSGSYIDQSGGHEGEDVFIYLDENEPSHPSKIIKEEKEKAMKDSIPENSGIGIKMPLYMMNAMKMHSGQGLGKKASKRSVQGTLN